MDSLIARVAEASGANQQVARQAVTLIVDFLEREGPEDATALLFNSAPALKAVVATYKTGGEGMDADLKGLTGVGSGMKGGGGLMELGANLMGLGLSMDQIQATGKVVFDYAREAAGDDVIGEISAGIPGLAQFI